MAEKAPLHNELAEGPDGGKAWWVRASDGVRVRAGYWPGSDRGTIIVLPGRSEYIEKYGRAAHDLKARGFSTMAIDWRGQGLADRLLADPMIGHVGRYSDYQADLMAVLKMAASEKIPGPYYMMGHSMGACIGLRALHAGLPFKSAIFIGPMWGIKMSPLARPVAWGLSAPMTWLGQGHHRTLFTTARAYVHEAGYEDNKLTSDRDMFEYIDRQTREVPLFALGGPSFQWLFRSLRETAMLRHMGPTSHKIVTLLGGNERIVNADHVHAVMDRWPGGRLEIVEGGEHELIIEKPEIRQVVFDTADAHFR